MAKKRRKKGTGIDPDFMVRRREALKRSHRKVIYFNSLELAAIDEYCSRFKVSSRSALIRQATMQRILEGLEQNHPTLF